MSQPQIPPGRSKNISTRPTTAGWLLLLILTAMLIASINYSNNLGFIFCFMIFSLILVSLNHTRSNTKGLNITNIRPQSAFVGGVVQFFLELHNVSSKRRIAIWLSVPDSRSKHHLFGPHHLESDSRKIVEISLPATHRGRFMIPGIAITSVYPLGLFYAGYYQKVQKTYLVYPKPAGLQPWPLPEPSPDEGSEGYHFSGGDDFAGLRPYRLGESQHRIDWKAVARGRPLSIKEFTGGGTLQIWFDWDKLAGVGTENRLSQLTRWVLEADQEDKEFGLKLPNKRINPDSSSRHTRECLEALAIFKKQE